jgi:hypothetical protein
MRGISPYYWCGVFPPITSAVYFTLLLSWSFEEK